MDSVKAPFNTSTVEMFTFVAESLFSSNCQNDTLPYDGYYSPTSSELNAYQSTLGYNYDISSAAYPPLFYDQGNDFSSAEELCSSDYSPLSTPEIDMFPPRLGFRLSPGLSFSDANTDGTLSSPLHLNENFNVFEFDFSTSLPNEFFPASESPPRHPSPLPSSCSRKASAHGHMPRSPRNLDAFHMVSHGSREPSPSTSDSDPKRRFPCLILGCARRFTSQYTLKVHMEAHKPKPRVSFPCTQGCSERFSRQHDRLRHEVAKHGRVCEFLCDECGRFFSSKKTLGNHKCPIAQGGTRWVV